MWIRFAGSKPTDTRAILSKWLNSGNKRSFQLAFDGSSDDLIFYVGSGSGIHHTISGSWTPSADTWYHVAVARYSGTITTYVNGGVIASGAGANSFDANDYAWEIGRANAGSYFPGHIDEVRLITDYARYTGAFKAPTTAFSAPVKNNSLHPVSMGANNTVGGSPANSTTKEVTLHCSLDSNMTSDIGLSGNNLIATGAGSSNWGQLEGTIAIAAGTKGYYEVTISGTGTSNVIGWGETGGRDGTGAQSFSEGDTIGYQPGSDALYTGTGTTASWASYSASANDVLMFAYDATDITAVKFWIGEGGTWFQSGNPATGANPAVTYNCTAGTIRARIHN